MTTTGITTSAPVRCGASLTQNRVGILNSTENIPLTIDAQYVAGFNWARQPAIRYVQDVGKIAWFGVSVEAPTANFASNGNGVAGGPAIGVPGVGTQTALATPNSGLTVPPGMFVNPGTNCNAGGLLNSATICSNNFAPDIIEKIALDPGWGHYEAIGLQRWFTDSVAPARPRPLRRLSSRAEAGARKQTSVGASAATSLCPFGRNLSTCRAAYSTAKGSAVIARANWLTS